MNADTTLDAWCRGYEAASDDRPASANPYQAGTDLAATWSSGWQKARSPEHAGLAYGVYGPTGKIESLTAI